MSRGHGKWERAILEALEQAAAFYLTDLLPMPHARSQCAALNRAARNLLDAGKIETVRWMCRTSQHAGFITVYRSGYPAPSREQVTRLKRFIGNSELPMQHLADHIMPR
jgi:hypothetical protein